MIGTGILPAGWQGSVWVLIKHSRPEQSGSCCSLGGVQGQKLDQKQQKTRGPDLRVGSAESDPVYALIFRGDWGLR